MRSHAWIPALVAAALAAGTAHGVEITPTVGYRDGEVAYAQSIVCLASIQAPCPIHVAADAGPAFGLIVDHELREGWGVEALVSRQESDLGFVDDPNTLPVEPVSLGDNTLTTTQFQVGVLYRRRGERFSPFAAATAGLAHLTTSGRRTFLRTWPQGEHPSASLGLGLQVGLARRISLRLEGRGWWTDLPRSVGGDLLQADAAAGLTFHW